MERLLAFLADHELLYLACAIGLGAVVGRIKIKGASLGAAAVLFTALGITALATSREITFALDSIALVGELGLALFAFAIGITSGPAFFGALRTSWPVLLAIVAIIVAAGGAAVAGGRLLGLPADVTAGLFAGALNNTPALAATGGTAGATVGYSVAYVYGVLGMMLLVNRALARRAHDSDSPPAIVSADIRVERASADTVAELEAQMGARVRVTRWRLGESDAPIVAEREHRLIPGVVLHVVGEAAAVAQVEETIGHRSSHHLVEDRSHTDFRRMTVSNSRIAGLPLRELHLERDYDAKVSRVRRGDVDLIASGETILQEGDRVRVIAPTGRMGELTKLFGDSTHGMTNVNPVALGLGLGLGLLLGVIAFPLPGGASLTLGAALGSLIVGLLMGRIARIGRVVTTLPFTSAQVLTEIGLLLFLAYAGTRAGGQIAQAFTSGAWWRILLVGLLVTTVAGVLAYVVFRRVFRFGGTRTSGMIAAMATQPALLALANERTTGDQRVSLGYSLAYPTAMVAKIVVATVLGKL